MAHELKRMLDIPSGSKTTERQYTDFLTEAYELLKRDSQYFAPDEDINCLELTHLIPPLAETVLAIYVGINDAVCNKGLVTPFVERRKNVQK